LMQKERKLSADVMPLIELRHQIGKVTRTLHPAMITFS